MIGSEFITVSNNLVTECFVGCFVGFKFLGRTPTTKETNPHTQISPSVDSCISFDGGPSLHLRAAACSCFTCFASCASSYFWYSRLSWARGRDRRVLSTLRCTYSVASWVARSLHPSAFMASDCLSALQRTLMGHVLILGVELIPTLELLLMPAHPLTRWVVLSLLFRSLAVVLYLSIPGHLSPLVFV